MNELSLFTKSLFFSFFLITPFLFAQTIMDNQEKLPYKTVPSPPDTYTAGTAVARMIDGLGFRYFWATEGLRELDLNYKPSENGRSMAETVYHIHQLSEMIRNAAQNKPNVKTGTDTLSFSEQRLSTLNNLKKASGILRKYDTLDSLEVIFKGRKNTVNFPFWYAINGPISDAIYHCGQIVQMRRASGNPIDPKVNVFSGRLKEK